MVRIFNTYGPHMHPQDGRVVSNFIVQALQGRPITIYGEGTQTRSFCYVDDLVAGFRKLMDSPDAITGPVNIGNPGEFTMIELAEMVLKLTGSKSQLVREPLPADDPKQRQPDITVARDVLGWEPTVHAQGRARPHHRLFRQAARGEPAERVAIPVSSALSGGLTACALP